MARSKSKKSNGKTQGELDGFEKPSIPELDDACSAHLKAQKAEKKAKDKASFAKSVVKSLMLKYMEAGSLEPDADENHVYGYADGDQEKVFKIRHDDVLTVVNAKKPVLEVVGEIG